MAAAPPEATARFLQPQAGTCATTTTPASCQQPAMSDTTRSPATSADNLKASQLSARSSLLVGVGRNRRPNRHEPRSDNAAARHQTRWRSASRSTPSCCRSEAAGTPARGRQVRADPTQALRCMREASCDPLSSRAASDVNDARSSSSCSQSSVFARNRGERLRIGSVAKERLDASIAAHVEQRGLRKRARRRGRDRAGSGDGGPRDAAERIAEVRAVGVVQPLA
jgi:hypothetical protein